jgi:hypothetical protein
MRLGFFDADSDYLYMSGNTSNEVMTRTVVKLHEALFLKSRTPVQSEVLTIHIKFSVAGNINRYPWNALPQPNYELHVRGMQSHEPHKVTYHPFVIQPYGDMHIVNRSFGMSPTHRGCPWLQVLPFTSLEDLDNKTRNIEGKFESGSWKDMLVCLPPAKAVNICSNGQAAD